MNLTIAHEVFDELLNREIAANLRTVLAGPESEHTIEIPAHDVAGQPLLGNVRLRAILDLADEHGLNLTIEERVVALK